MKTDRPLADIRSIWPKLTAILSRPFFAALLLGAGFFGFVAWDQSHWWLVKEDYQFGWLVPLFVAFVVRDRWPAIEVSLTACAASASLRASGWQKWLLRLFIAGAFLLGTLLFLLGAFYRASAGPSQPGTLAITLGAVALVLALLFVNAPDSPASAPGTIFSDARVKLTTLFAFPVLIWLVSAPIVSVIESQLNVFLLRKVVTAVAFVFDFLGVPIEQQGNVLVLPNGKVGVAEACSGIRSLTGCVFTGWFLGAVFCDRAWKKIILLAAAMALAFVTNLARSLFLTSWAYRFGPAAIEGKVHDAAGYAVLGLTFVGLMLIVPILNWRPGNRIAESRAAS
jgi:exosortase